MDADTRFAVGVAHAADIFRGAPHVAERTLKDERRIAAEAAVDKHKEERLAFFRLLDAPLRGEHVAWR